LAKVSTSIAIRHFRDDDLPRVLELLRSSLGGGPGGMRTADFFRWKHLENPFGRSFALLGEADGRLVGFRAFMRWRLSAAGTPVLAVRAVDTATHPDYQGRGIFSTLTRRSLEALRDEADLVFNTPNEKSLPGYLKMGWQIAGNVPVRVRVRRPFRFVRRIRSLHEEIDVPLEKPPISAATAADVLAGEGSLPDLLLRTSSPDRRLATQRDLEYLRWRYGAAPLLDYRVVEESSNGRLNGVAIFRVRPRGRLWESTIAEVLVAPGDRGTAAKLLASVRDACPVDHLTCFFPADAAAARAARWHGYLRVPFGMTLAVNPLSPGSDPDPRHLSSWALSLGDLEVF